MLEINGGLLFIQSLAASFGFMGIVYLAFRVKERARSSIASLGTASQISLPLSQVQQEK